MDSSTFTTVVVRNPDLIAANIDSDLVMMSIAQGEYYNIAGVGSRIWELLATPISIEEITRTICAEYNVNEATCRTDIQIFIEELIHLGLAARV